MTVAAVAPALAGGADAERHGGDRRRVAVDPGQWSGQPAPELALQWRAGGVAIPGATAAGFVPTPAEDGADLDCLVTATNAGGSVALAAGPLRVTQAPPVALGAIADLALTQGGAPGRVEAAGHFAGGSPELLRRGRRGGDRRSQRGDLRSDRRRCSPRSRWWSPPAIRAGA